MKLVTQVQIRGFRSIQDQTLSEFGSFTGLVGKNSSGKSNVLRALNLFFNGEVEPGKPLSFSRDHYEQVPRTRKKKKISIKVNFSITERFKFRKGLTHLESLGPNFSITREWELDQRRKEVESFSIETAGDPVQDAANSARQFLSLVSFRYIPNRAIPSELLKDESQAIADSIFMRMPGDTHADALLTSLTKAATQMLKPASDSLRATGAPLRDPQVTTAETLGEMLRMTGFQAVGPHGGKVQDEDWGAGHQSFFLYSVLLSLDTMYRRFFGWRQATIWGVEEPESALHRDLETRLADRLRKWSFDDSSRLQVIHTTHSPIFTMASDIGYWVEVADKETTLERTRIPELTRAAETRGVSGWVHPLLSFPWNPVILVEGQIDAEALTHAASLGGHDELRFVALRQLDPTEKGGGKDSIVGYLRRNQGLAQNRPKESPLLVLLDWEVSEQELKQTREAYGVGGEHRVIRMDAKHCNWQMGASFKGIERFYPPSVITDAQSASELVLGVATGKPYSIAADQLNAAKGKLLSRLRKISTLTDLAALLKVVGDLIKIIGGVDVVQLLLPSGRD